MSNSELKERISQLLNPVGPCDGPRQYPRPWMTDLSEPGTANVFIVGYNQATPYLEQTVNELVGGSAGYMNALFNCHYPRQDGNVKPCRMLYDEIRNGGASPTRTRIDRLQECLTGLGAKVLETNVICYSTNDGAEVRRNDHSKGREQGRQLFGAVLTEIRPRILIVHGSDSARDLEAMLQTAIPRRGANDEADQIRTEIRTQLGGLKYELTVFSILHLAYRALNEGQRGALANECRRILDEK